MDARLNDASNHSQATGFGHNSFSPVAKCSCAKLLKLFRIILVAPLYLCMYVFIVLWPLGVLLEGFNLVEQLLAMRKENRLDSTRCMMVLFYALLIWFLVRMPAHIRKAISIQFIERFMMCCKSGKLLEVVKTSESTSDMILDESFVSSSGGRRVLNVVGQHQIRRSLDMTMTETLNSGAYGPIQENDVMNPKFFLTGMGGASIEGMEELWTSHASMTSWPALYAWCESLPLFRLSIPLGDDTTVLGYFHLLETSAPIDAKRITTRYAPCMGPSPCCMRSDQVIARHWYWAKTQFGNFPAGQPDAYIFKTDSIRELGLKATHTFRVCVHAPQHTPPV